MICYKFNLLIKHEVRCLCNDILRNESNILNTCNQDRKDVFELSFYKPKVLFSLPPICKFSGESNCDFIHS
jgi:hypothetical protein